MCLVFDRESSTRGRKGPGRPRKYCKADGDVAAQPFIIHARNAATCGSAHRTMTTPAPTRPNNPTSFHALSASK